jgi:TM2 domain-containing membrane protein YozV
LDAPTCLACAAPLLPDALYCARCGARVNAPLAPPTEARPASLTLGASQGTPVMLAPFGLDPVSGLPFSYRKRVVGGLLQIFFGWLGLGRFYTGHVGLAIAQILASMTCIGFLWPLIDGVQMLAGQIRDVDGRPLRD